MFGYTTGNDFTARDTQMRVSQWMTGKTPDQFAPIGPWLVTADQIPDPQTLQMQTCVNDETTPRQDMNTAQMIFNCAHIVSYTSSFITLQPGDVIFTGTPSGVISAIPRTNRSGSSRATASARRSPSSANCASPPRAEVGERAGARGGIGRRAGFRFQWGDPSEFESRRAHMASALGRSRASSLRSGRPGGWPSFVLLLRVLP